MPPVPPADGAVRPLRRTRSAARTVDAAAPHGLTQLGILEEGVSLLGAAELMHDEGVVGVALGPVHGRAGHPASSLQAGDAVIDATPRVVVRNSVQNETDGRSISLILSGAPTAVDDQRS